MKSFYFVDSFYKAIYIISKNKTLELESLTENSISSIFFRHKINVDGRKISNLFVLNSKSKDQPEKGPDKEIKIQ